MLAEPLSHLLGKKSGHIAALWNTHTHLFHKRISVSPLGTGVFLHAVTNIIQDPVFVFKVVHTPYTNIFGCLLIWLLGDSIVVKESWRRPSSQGTCQRGGGNGSHRTRRRGWDWVRPAVEGTGKIGPREEVLTWRECYLCYKFGSGVGEPEG